MASYKGLRRPRRRKTDTDDAYAARLTLFEQNQLAGIRETRRRQSSKFPGMPDTTGSMTFDNLVIKSIGAWSPAT